MKNKYAKERHHRKLKKQYIKRRYNMDPDFQRKQKQYLKERCSSNPDLKSKRKIQMQKYLRDRYSTDSNFKCKQKDYMKDRYRADLDFKCKQKDYMKDYIKDRYRADLDFKCKQKDYVKDRYSTDLDFQSQQKKYVREKYRNNPDFRLHHLQHCSRNRRDRLAKNAALRIRYKLQCALRIKRKYMDIVNQRQETPHPVVNPVMEEAISTFRERIRHGPTHVCTVCHRALFPNQVRHCNRAKYVKNICVVAACLTGKYVHVCDTECSAPCTVPQDRMREWICHTCHSHLSRGRMPSMAAANNLELAPIPPELEDLNVLERQLIAKILPFAKIVALPKGRQRAVHGAVVCVPSELEATVNALPRPSAEAQLLQVKLKRNIKYKGYQHFFTVNMKNVLAGLRILKETHSEYTNIEIDDCAEFESLEDLPVDEEEPQEAPDAAQPEEQKSRRGEEDMEPVAGTSREKQPKDVDKDKEKEDLRPGLALDTCMQPPDIAQEVLSYGDGIFSIAPAQGNKPVGFFAIPKLEAMAFPVQFPTGENTLDERRRILLSPSAYFNTRLLCVDIRFARDQSYLFFSQFVTETHMARNSMSIQTRKGKKFTKDGRKISNKMLQDKDELEQLIQTKEATRFMQPLRGTPAYWEKTLRDLHAMVRQLGKPTFFITFSAAEMRWPEVINIIKAQQGEEGDFSELDWNEKCEILHSNPVTVMRLFEKRVDALMTDLLLSPAQPIGPVEDYFYRVEFQARGSPHIHMLVWIKDAPEIEDPECCPEVVNFIDRYICCQMPDEESDPELHKIVSEVQVHSRNHSKTCRKGNVSCRFGFPKLPMEKTIIACAPWEADDDDDDDDDEKKDDAKKKDQDCGKNDVDGQKKCGEKSKDSRKSQKKSQKKFIAKQQRIAKEKLKPVRDLLMDPNASFKDLTELLEKCNMLHEEYRYNVGCLTTGMVVVNKRDPKDCWVNGYNPDLLRAWNANMDIQYVIDDFSCIMYMMSYVSKPEHEMTEFLNSVVQEVRKSDVNKQDEMNQIMQAYAKHREVSAQESVARVCSLPLKKCSRSVIFIQTDEDGMRMSHPMSRLQNMAADEEDVWMSGLPEKYAMRPDAREFEYMCLAEFASEYRVLYGRQRESANAIPLQKDHGFIQKRTSGKPAIIRFTRFSEKKHPEKFYRRLLKLYCPHREDADLKTERHPTYEAYYKSGCLGQLPVKGYVDFNRKRYEGEGKKIDKAIERLQKEGPVINAWNSFAPEVELDRLECVAQREAISRDEEEQEQLPDFQLQGGSSGAMPGIQAPELSPDFVRNMFRSLNETQSSAFYAIREWCWKRVWGKYPEPFFYFISGGAGCGKSHLIKCAYQEATKILRQLPRFRNEGDMSQPSVLLAAFTGTAAFNISGKTLHSLLKLPRSLKPPYQGLGNTLDDVRAALSNAEILIIDEISMVSKELFSYVHWRFQQIKGNRRPFGGMSVLAVGDFYQLPPLGRAKPLCVLEDDVLNLWQDFKLVNLTEIMRQKDDRTFAELLNRIRTRNKKDPLSADDEALLAQAVVEVGDCPADALHIFATNKEVDEHNVATLTALKLQVVNIPAQDYTKDLRTGEMELATGLMKGNKRDLPDNLQAAQGARVMVIRNLDIEDGMVNGTFGTIGNIVTTTEHGQTVVKVIGLELDNHKAGQKFRKKIQGAEDNLVYVERFEESMSRRGVVRRQFPMKLAFGCTAHKVQGMTVDSAVVSLKRIFEPGMAYVALSRTTSLQGLRIINYEEQKIYADPKITTAMETMSHASFESARPLLHYVKTADHTGPTLKIVHHNCQGLPSHMDDIRTHHEFRLADVLCITESHLSGSFVSPDFQLEGYEMFARNRNVSYSNRADMAMKDGGGVAVYYRNSLQAESRRYFQNVPDLEFAVVKVEGPVRALIATVYRPPNIHLDMFLQNMQSLLDSLEMMGCQPVVVCGDFNEDLLSKGKKAIQELFLSRGYSQLVSTATTEKQTLIDHIYISQPECCLQSGVLQSYYSYHDPVYCVLTSP
ncbi:uncharacterized protein LOC131982826 isoform X1 [Centropristis striata]|uniref:uncharacterized protein LOC131982826 isoform X1 n=1 Tax=Centropristis striata TaxID=184440 RepID=UPI0027DF5E07|nr:uncharacterized protein LOC131982826 isoform X1 [Centropristis striata]